MLNHQGITSPHNEPQRSPGFVQKQPPVVFYKKRCSYKYRKFYRKTTVLEPLFNNVADLRDCNFIKKILQQCFLMKSAKLLRMPILKNNWERLLLFVSPKNTITNSGGKFGLDDTLTECQFSLNVAISFN